MPSPSKLQALSIQLISMKVPNVSEESLSSADQTKDVRDGFIQSDTPILNTCKLLINPGEPSEIIVKIKNTNARSLIVNLRIEGDFPESWYRIGMEGDRIPAYGEMEAVLYFQVPIDFFENPEAIARDQALTINYQGQIHIYGGYADPASNSTNISTDNSNTDLPEDQLLSNNPTSSNSPNPRVKLELLDISSLRLYIRPHSLYLEFLPDIFREVDFVGRLLKIFEESLEPDVKIFDALWAYVDPILAPETMLPFLAHWVGWEMSPLLDIKRQRYLIKQAMQIYRWRGTRRGLRFYIHLFTGLPLDEHLPEGQKHIDIFEVAGRGFILNEAQLGVDASAGGGRPFHFIVRIRNDLPSTINIDLIHQIIEREKPAFCTYDLEII